VGVGKASCIAPLDMRPCGGQSLEGDLSSQVRETQSEPAALGFGLETTQGALGVGEVG